MEELAQPAEVREPCMRYTGEGPDPVVGSLSREEFMSALDDVEKYVEEVNPEAVGPELRLRHYTGKAALIAARKS